MPDPEAPLASREDAALLALLDEGADLSLELADDDTVLAVVARQGLAWSALVGCRWGETIASHREQARAWLRDARAGHRPEPLELLQFVPGEVAARGHFRFRVARHSSGRVLLAAQDLLGRAALDPRRAIRAQLEARDQLLFGLSTEPLLVVDARALIVIEPNPAGATFFRLSAEALRQRPLAALFDPPAVEQIAALCRGQLVEAKVAFGTTALTLSASSWSEGGVPRVLLRLQPSALTSPGLAARDARLLAVLEGLGDGVVVIGNDRRVLSANPAFGTLLGCEVSELIGLPIDRLLGRSPLDVSALLMAIEARGAVRNFVTLLRPARGGAQAVSVSGAAGVDEHGEFFGFSVRPAPPPAERLVPLPGAVAQLRDLVGRVSLKRIVGESSDLVERLCLEAALTLTEGDRPSAAQLLGISRQSLALKLKRHGLAGPSPL